MKKILLIMVVVLAFALSSSMAFAEKTITEAGTSIGDTAFATSKLVTISIASQDQAYTAYSKHKNGNQAFCGCGGEGVTGCESIKSKSAAAGKDVTQDPGNVTAADAGCSSW